MTISPDMAALNYGQADEPANEIDTLATMAAEYGYRLVPINSDETVNAVIPAANPDTPEDMVRRLTWLKAAIKSAEAVLKAHKAECEAVDAELQEKWIEAGRTSDTIDGFTASLSPRWSYSRNDDVETEDIIQALHKIGWDYLVKPTFSARALLGQLTGMVKEKAPIPEALTELITLKQNVSITVVPAGKKKSGGLITPFTGA